LSALGARGDSGRDTLETHGTANLRRGRRAWKLRLPSPRILARLALLPAVCRKDRGRRRNTASARWARRGADVNRRARSPPPRRIFGRGAAVRLANLLRRGKPRRITRRRKERRPAPGGSIDEQQSRFAVPARLDATTDLLAAHGSDDEVALVNPEPQEI